MESHTNNSSKPIQRLAVAATFLTAAVLCTIVWSIGYREGDGTQEKPVGQMPPVFVAVEPLVVNLQPEDGEHYLNVEFVMQVDDQDQAALIRRHMAEVRNRLLMLLSSKKASQISAPDGKRRLVQEIYEQLNRPFDARDMQQKIVAVFPTTLLIQ